MSITEDRRQPHRKAIARRKSVHRHPDEHLERMRRFDDAFAKVFGWVAVAVFVVIALVAVLAA